MTKNQNIPNKEFINNNNPDNNIVEKLPKEVNELMKEVINQIKNFRVNLYDAMFAATFKQSEINGTIDSIFDKYIEVLNSNYEKDQTEDTLRFFYSVNENFDVDREIYKIINRFYLGGVGTILIGGTITVYNLYILFNQNPEVGTFLIKFFITNMAVITALSTGLTVFLLRIEALAKKLGKSNHIKAEFLTLSSLPYLKNCQIIIKEANNKNLNYITTLNSIRIDLCKRTEIVESIEAHLKQLNGDQDVDYTIYKVNDQIEIFYAETTLGDNCILVLITNESFYHLFTISQESEVEIVEANLDKKKQPKLVPNWLSK